MRGRGAGSHLSEFMATLKSKKTMGPLFHGCERTLNAVGDVFSCTVSQHTVLFSSKNLEVAVITAMTATDPVTHSRGSFVIPIF